MPATLTLRGMLRDRGAVLASRGGEPVAAHYGSAATELALCVRAVGVAWRPELAAVTLDAAPDAIDSLCERVTGERLAPGGALREGAAWWARSPRLDQLTLLCPHDALGRVLSRSLESARSIGLRVSDRSADTAVIEIVGRRCWRLLAELGAGEVRAATPFSELVLAGHATSLLIASEVGAFVLAPATAGCEAWCAIELAGGPLGLGRVGHEALERYSVARAAIAA